jgi:hypothetical protein
MGDQTARRWTPGSCTNLPAPLHFRHGAAGNTLPSKCVHSVNNNMWHATFRAQGASVHRLAKQQRTWCSFGILSNSSTQQTPLSASTTAPASNMESPVTASRTTDTVRPAVVHVLPHTYSPRGAAADTACSRKGGTTMHEWMNEPHVVCLNLTCVRERVVCREMREPHAHPRIPPRQPQTSPDSNCVAHGVRPAVVHVLPHTYSPRGAAADTACSRTGGTTMCTTSVSAAAVWPCQACAVHKHSPHGSSRYSLPTKAAGRAAMCTHVQPMRRSS